MTSRTFRTFLIGACISASACDPAARVTVDRPLTELQSAAEADSADAVAQYNLALGYWSHARFTDARGALLRAVALDSRFAEAYLALGFLPYAQRPALWQEIAQNSVPDEWLGAIDEASEHYRRALMINPLVDMRILGAVAPPPHWAWTSGPLQSAYEAWFRGFDDYRSGNYGAAYGRYNRLIRDLEISWRRDARLHMPSAILLHRGLAAAHLGIWDIAVGDLRIVYDRFRSLEDEDELIHVPLETNHYRYVLGVLLAASGDHVEAESLLQDAATENLGLYMAHVRLADIAESRGDGRLALAERQRAIDANPEDPSLYLDKGLTYANVGRLEDAATTIADAIALNPLGAQAHYFLGVVNAMRGDGVAARASFERFLALAPTRMTEEIRDAERRLAVLADRS